MSTKPKTKHVPTATADDIVKLLNSGLSVAQVHQKTGRTKRWIHMVSTERKAPKNRPVPPGSVIENSIIRTFIQYGHNAALTAKAHNQSPKTILAIISRVQNKPKPRKVTPPALRPYLKKRKKKTAKVARKAAALPA